MSKTKVAELIVPRKPYRWSDDLEAHKVRRDFEYEVSQILDKLFTNWRNYISYTWSDDYFVLKKSKDAWRGRVLTRFKQNDVFVLDDKRIKNIQKFIDEKVQEQNRITAYHQALDDAKALVEPVLQKYRSDTLTAELETAGKIALEIGADDKDGWFDSSTSVEIYSSGEIGEPRVYDRTEIRTLSAAQKFIQEFKPILTELQKIAEQVKSELPKEWFKE